MIRLFKNIVSHKYSAIWLNILVWLAIFALPIIIFDVPKHNHFELLFHAATIIFFFYLNTQVLIPKLLSKGKPRYYIVSLVTCLVIAGSTATVLDKKYFKKLVDINVLNSPENERLADSIEKWNPEIKNNHDALLREIYDARGRNRMPFNARTVITIMFAFAVGTSIKITQEWFLKEKERKEAENARLDAEISLLKWQVNPHFLFNTLNGIYSLANRKSEKTADSVARLSNILRYMLYDTNVSEVKLHDEIQYLTDYIELQKLRMHDNVHISFEITGDVSQVFIAPMLLLPFVENAFKHGTDTSSDCFIDVRLKVENYNFSFIVENSVPLRQETIKDKSSGIGLKNVERRLKLHYPNSHMLEVNQHGRSFHVNLQINLSSHEVHYS